MCSRCRRVTGGWERSGGEEVGQGRCAGGGGGGGGSSGGEGKEVDVCRGSRVIYGFVQVNDSEYRG